MSLHTDAAAELRAWNPSAAAQADPRDVFLDHLEGHPDGVWRTCAPAYLTASAVILDPIQRAILRVLHRKVGRWLQPGGHCEVGDASLGAAALREGSEESGVGRAGAGAGNPPRRSPSAPCNPGVVEEYFDVRYLVLAPAGSVAVASPESLDARWFGWDELPEGIEPTIVEMLTAARRRLG